VRPIEPPVPEPPYEARIHFRPLIEADYSLVFEWLKKEHVQRWWGKPLTRTEVAEKYGPRVRGEMPTRAFVLEYEGRPVGYIQTYLVADHPEYAAQVRLGPGAAGVDLFLGEAALLHRGLGTAALRRFLREVVFADPTVTCCVLGPAPDNAAAIRAYEKVGFRYWKTVPVAGAATPEYLMLLHRHELRDVG
jgi:RimJ/RimL family protein N-acetyltransferase